MPRFIRWLTALAGALTITAGAAGAQAVPSGQSVFATMQTAMSTKNANVGDEFVMNVVQPYPNGADLSGATIHGHVSKVVRAGQGTKAELDFAFDRLYYSDGSSVPISANLQSLDQKSETSHSVLTTAATALGGMLLGNAIGKTIFHVGGFGVIGALGGILYGQNAKANIDVNQGAQAQLTLEAPLRSRRQATQ